MGKLEKLREVNELISKLIIELEAQLFIENISVENDDIKIKPKENTVVKTNKI